MELGGGRQDMNKKFWKKDLEKKEYGNRKNACRRKGREQR